MSTDQLAKQINEANRREVIANAKREYNDSGRQNRAICSQRAWVNNDLRERGMSQLTADESLAVSE